MTDEYIRDDVLQEAVVNVSNKLHIPEQSLLDYLHLQSVQYLEAKTDAGLKALKLVNAYQNIVSVTGDEQAASHWFNTTIKSMKDSPFSIFCQEGDHGLEKIAVYLQRFFGH